MRTAQLSSGKFAANAAWLVLSVIALNLARAAAAATGSDLAKVTTVTVRRTLIQAPLPSCVLGAANHPSPAPQLALADRLDPAVTRVADPPPVLAS